MKKYGLMALKGVVRGAQSRRRRRGKRQIFPTMFRDKTKSNNTNRTINVPVRRNITNASSSGGIDVIDSELVSYAIPVDTTLNGDFDNVLVSPAIASLWPKLYQKGLTYAKYSINGLRLSYVPAVGTAVNGTFWFGFSNNLGLNEGSILSTQDIESLPVRGYVSVSEPKTWEIPASAMCQKGQNLIRDKDLADVSSLPLYTPGILFYGSSGVTAGVTNIGTLRLTYSVRYDSPQMNLEPNTSNGACSATGNFSVYRAGLCSLEDEGTNHMSTAFNHPCALLVQSVTADGLTVTRNAVPLVATHTFVEGANQIDSYVLDAGVSDVTFANNASGFWVMVHPTTTGTSYWFH
jgi:hypothetical protein